MPTALDLVDSAIADLEARLKLAPGASPGGKKANNNKDGGKGKANKKGQPPPKQGKNEDQPDICKLEFKVGVITKAWNHPDGDKLYCEEIDVGEEAVRQIASGLRPHYTLEEMMGQRLLVVSNLKAKNLIGFKSHGMVLCAAEKNEDGSETVKFVEPPLDAKIGEVITFEGLPKPEPWSGSQVDKKKVFAACMEGMKTTGEGLAAWNGHVFTTSAGPCKCSLKNAVMR
jgi:aminoacyl tRNA synthase complex-interacting multifunctional protein 1